MFVTVNICTWNRADLLRQALECMTRLHVPEGVEWELLLVNNNCTDHTDLVAAEFAERLPLKLMHEPTPGKSFALNRAVAEARGELMLFTDDDALVEPDWLQQYVREASSRPEAMYFGGPVEPWFVVEPPEWLKRHLKRLAGVYAIRPRTDSTVEIANESLVPYGVNMAIRTATLRQHPFDVRLGPSGKSEVRGEELDLFARLKAAGCSGVWLGCNAVRHYIPQQRITAGYIYEFWRGFGVSEARGAGVGGRVPWWAFRAWCESSLCRCFWSPWKNDAWLRSLILAARAHGAIWEWQRLRRSGDLNG